jgi:acetyl esterase/lipase
VLDAYLAELPGLAEVADQCAAAYRGYLPNAADRSHPYASPLQSSRLKNLPPALILSSEDDPLRDEAEQYGEQIDRLRQRPPCGAWPPRRCRTPGPATNVRARCRY